MNHSKRIGTLQCYFHDGINQRPETLTLGEINDMIENGTIETFFAKLK